MAKLRPKRLRLDSGSRGKSYLDPRAFNKADIYAAGILFVLAAWMLDNWFQTGVNIVHWFCPMPVFDYWRTVYNLNSYYHLDLRILWRQHNEHRIIFPELIYITDYFLFHGREVLPVVCSVLFQAASWAIISWTLFRTRNVPPRVAIGASLLAGVLMGWPGSALLLTAPFLLQWTFCEIGVILALLALTRVPRSPDPNRVLWAAIGAGTITNYSSGNGLVIWPVLVLAAFWAGLNRRQIITLAACGSFLTALFFVGYQRSSSLHFEFILKEPVYWLGFVGTMLGMPFGAVATRFGIAVGLGSIVLLAYLIFRTARLGLRREPVATVLLGSCLFVLASVLLISLGRLDLKDSEYFYAKAYRYLALPLLYWGCLILSATWHASYPIRPSIAMRYVLVAITVMVAWRLPEAKPWVAHFGNDFSRFQFSALALEAGVEDEQMIQETVFPVYLPVHQNLPLLKEHRASIFSDSRFTWVGKSFRSLSMSKANDPMTGGVSTLPESRPGVGVVGWTPTAVHAKEFVFVDYQGTIVGLGARIPGGLPLELHASLPEQTASWAGMINNTFKARVVQAYAVSNDRHTLSPIGPPITLDGNVMGTANDSGSRIEGITWTPDPAWTPRGFYPGLKGTPDQGAVWGSWSGNDQNRGRLTSSEFAVPASGCFVIPIGHGPSLEGQSVTAQDVNGNALVTIPLTQETSDWRNWIILSIAGGTHVRLVASDNGSGWGQWLAIADPHECKGNR